MKLEAGCVRLHLHLSLPCTATTAASEFASYLAERHATISTPDPFSVSAVAPLALLNIDRRNYSRANWIGLNPVVQADRIEARASETAGGSSLDVTITSLRFYFFPAIWVFVAVAVSRASVPLAAWAFMVLVLLAYCSAEFWLLSRGIREEFVKYLRGRPLTIVGGGREAQECRRGR
jgi:hypothetical protein